MLKIIKVSKSSEVDRFIHFAWEVYKPYSPWVPPLVQQTKEFLLGDTLFFEHCEHQLFMAEEDGKICAVAAAFYDRNLVEHYGQKIGLIGYFETLPNAENAVGEIFKYSEDFLRDKGAEVIWAPFNGTINYGVCLLADAYDESPLFLMSYNPSWYHDYFRRRGYAVFKNMVAFKTDLLDGKLQRKIVYVNRKAELSTIKIRSIDLKNFQEDVNRFCDIYSRTFKYHWGYAPQSKEETFELFNQFRFVLEKDFILFAEDEGDVIGFVLCVPDYNEVIKQINGNMNAVGLLRFLRLKKKIKHARLIAIGVDNAYRGQGIAPMLIARAYQAMIEKKYTSVEYSWVLSENVSSKNAANKFHGKIYKNYIVYSKNIK